MKKTISLLFLTLIFSSCVKPGNDQKINTNFNHKILDGYFVTSLAFDNNGNTWIGTNDQGLIKYNSIETEVFNSTNSQFPDSSWINDIKIDSKGNIWIGANGLIKYDGTTFTLFNSGNSAVPEDYVRSIAIDSKDNIWFTSARFQEGGLVKYDGTTFDVFTPANSSLPVNFIQSIAIDRDDNIWLALSEKVNNVYLVKISNGDWSVYSKNELGFSPYYFGNIQINSKNQVCAAIDHSLGGPLIDFGPQLFIFNGSSSKQLNFNNTSLIQSIMVDSNDNIWCIGFFGVLAVYNGKDWTINYASYPDVKKDGLSTIGQSPDNKIWLGTGNGIYLND